MAILEGRIDHVRLHCLCTLVDCANWENEAVLLRVDRRVLGQSVLQSLWESLQNEQVHYEFDISAGIVFGFETRYRRMIDVLGRFGVAPWSVSNQPR